MDGGSLYAALLEVLYLVFHQGYQRCDDDAHTLLCKCRNLKRDRLSSTCRHQTQSIFSGGNAFDDIALYATEVGKSPVSM